MIRVRQTGKQDAIFFVSSALVTTYRRRLSTWMSIYHIVLIQPKSTFYGFSRFFFSPLKERYIAST